MYNFYFKSEQTLFTVWLHFFTVSLQLSEWLASICQQVGIF